MGHTSRTFAISAFGVLMLGFLNVIVSTRFLNPSEYGELAILLVFSSMLTVIYGLGSLQGTLLVVFGSAGEEDVEDTDDEATDTRQEGALGTGLLLTTIVVGLGTAAVAATSGDLAGWLLGDGGKSDLILLAAISGDRGHLAAGEQRGQDGAAAGNLRHSPCRPTRAGARGSRSRSSSPTAE